MCWSGIRRGNCLKLKVLGSSTHFGAWLLLEIKGFVFEKKTNLKPQNTSYCYSLGSSVCLFIQFARFGGEKRGQKSSVDCF